MDSLTLPSSIGIQNEDLGESLLTTDREANLNGSDEDEDERKNASREVVDESDSSRTAIIYAYISVALADMNYSLLIPFFPKAALERHLKPGTIGILFAVFHLIHFLASFVSPKISEKYTGSNVLMYCNLSLSISSGLLSITGMFRNPIVFFVSCFALRCLQGLFASIIEATAGRLAMQNVRPDKMGETLSRLEGCRTLGTMTGPLLGGALYKLIGYGGPFIGTSILQATIVLFMARYPIRNAQDACVPNENETMRTSAMQKRLLKSPIVILTLLNVYILILGITFIEPTLQPYLSSKPYNFNEFEVGLIFTFYLLLLGVSATLSSIIVKFLGNIFSLFMGIFLMSSAYFLMAPPKNHPGPLSLFSSLHQSHEGGATGLLLGGLILLSLGGGLCFVPINLLLVFEGEYLRKSVLETSDAIAGLLNTSFTIGAALGPFLSGIFSGEYGFSRSCALLGLIIFIFDVTMLITYHGVQFTRFIYKLREITPEIISDTPMTSS